MICSAVVKRFLHIGIIAFCVWHMFAVGVFAIPRDASDALSVASRQYLLPVVIPYMDITSQWQLWNLFAPDPYRRITLFKIEQKKIDGTWQEVETIKPGTYPWWEHAIMFKYEGNVLDTNDGQYSELKTQFLTLQCKTHAFLPGTPMKLTPYTAILPWVSTPVSMDFWTTWTPEWTRGTSILTSCPLKT